MTSNIATTQSYIEPVNLPNEVTSIEFQACVDTSMDFQTLTIISRRGSRRDSVKSTVTSQKNIATSYLLSFSLLSV